ncbi:hypothetical protein HBI34_231990 [Parastagonospora nodorum]|nr:hypothetical protein HBI34_231990 [Parastagonospora nodorum]
MHASLRKELEARHSLLNLSVYDLVEEFARHNYSSLYYSNSNSDTATRKTRIKACARLIKRQRLELEAQLRKASEEEDLLDSDDYCLDSSLDINPKNDLEDEEERLKALLNAKYSLCESRDSNRTLHSRRNKRIIKLLARAYILYFKELLSNNSRIFASVIGITRTQAIKNKVVAIDPANSILCNLSNLLVVRFCIFSNSALENISILTNKEVANMPAMHSKATKHCLALLAAQFTLVCSFRKGRTVFNKFYNCKSESIIIAKFYKDL